MRRREDKAERIEERGEVRSREGEREGGRRRSRRERQVKTDHPLEFRTNTSAACCKCTKKHWLRKQSEFIWKQGAQETRNACLTLDTPAWPNAGRTCLGKKRKHVLGQMLE